MLPIDRWPDTPSTYIVMRGDRAVGGTWAPRQAARVGAEVVEIDGGHSPFCSRPDQLATALVAAY
ncbi:alpha/beta hydrolase [Mycobacterium asiaticum]|uniref:alpha/beta hydrolase n=1 Tax=Mycobacterium asiaticum TaxID=1790 RepID=UPI0005677AFD|nr:alpha/beta hydrolase [Mycobacterium asiaticum]ORA18732.1 hypothetical protein BST16_00795 [Mycobacterium asiaticum DSM 44297]